MHIKNIADKSFLKKKLGKSGQIAIILILFIAVFLAALAVVINLQNISLRKTAAVVAVDSAAAFMASMYASYAESLYQGIIEPGKNKEGTELTRSATQAWLQKAVSIIIGVVCLILAIVAYVAPGAQGVGLLLTAVVVAALSLAVSITALVLELAVVVPEQNKMWGKMFQYLKTYDKFREQGIQTLFSQSASDPVNVNDMNDYNMDGRFEGDGMTPKAKQVSRFSVLYTKRAEYLQAKGDLNMIGEAEGRVVYAWQDKDKPGQPVGSGKWHIIRAEVGVPMRCNGKCARTSCNRKNITNLPFYMGDIIDDGPCPEPFLPWVNKYPIDIFTNNWSLIDGVNKENDSQKNGVCGVERWDPLTVTNYGKWTYKVWQICFKGGLVMARINRYDEGGGLYNWATGLVFWENRFKNINATGSGDPNKIEEKCGNIMGYTNTQNCPNWVKNAPQVDPGSGPYTPDCGISWGMPGAFVLNEATQENAECWQLMHQLLNQGTEARSCAEYFFRDNADSSHNCTSAFGVKFVSCPDRW